MPAGEPELSWLLKKRSSPIVGWFKPVDSSIVNVALPDLRQRFHVRSVQLQWVVNAYLLAISGILPAIRQRADLRGRKSPIYIRTDGL